MDASGLRERKIRSVNDVMAGTSSATEVLSKVKMVPGKGVKNFVPKGV